MLYRARCASHSISLHDTGKSAATADPHRVELATVNRILRSERCCLMPEHVDILIKISTEGPLIPDVRDGMKAEEAALNLLLDEVVNEWKKDPHRETDL